MRNGDIDDRPGTGGYVETAELGPGESPVSLGLADDFKAAMCGLAATVVMVTTRVEGRPWGLTISTCCSLSLEPPQILISLNRQTTSRMSAVDGNRFGVSIFRASHKPLAELGASVGTPKFIDGFLEGSGPEDAFVEGHTPASFSPVVAGARFHLDCSVAQTFEVATHTLLVGLVERVVVGCAPARGDEKPLLYYERTFRYLGEEIA